MMNRTEAIASMKRHQAAGALVATAGGTIASAGVMHFFGWPGVAIVVGSLMFAAGLWSAIMATSAMHYISEGGAQQ